MDSMYQENILDHAKHPRNWGLLHPHDVEAEGRNPLCGDHLHLTLRVEQGHITAVGWEGHGCAISQAAASMVGEELIGMTLEAAQKIPKEHLYELIGIPLSMNRVKCALLSLKVVKIAAYGLTGIASTEQDEDDE
jgi:nitrogen fixation protein NifU and related proteins